MPWSDHTPQPTAIRARPPERASARRAEAQEPQFRTQMTFRFNLDLEFKNGVVLTVEREAQGDDLAQASLSARQELQDSLEQYLAEVLPINFYEQLDPLPVYEED